MSIAHIGIRDISEAKDPDLRAALGALKRASFLARETAIQTGTCIIIVQNGKQVRVSADELRQQRASQVS